MEVIICSTAADAGRTAAGKVTQIAKACGPEAVIGFSTGSSPLATYADLTRRIDSRELDLTQAWGFALDEYVGLQPGHPESYAEVIRRTVTEPLQMNPDRVFTPNGFAENLKVAGAQYEEQIRAVGGVDVQILGVGANGHIGFNEPGSSLASRTRIKTLTSQTRVDNSRFFASLDEVPRHCLTQGLGTIMDAKNVVLVAQGEAKADAIAALVEGAVSAGCPGSVLQFHRSATIVIDEAAATELKHADYYREAFAFKPSWQRFE